MYRDQLKDALLARISPRTKKTEAVLEELTRYQAQTPSAKPFTDEEVWTLLFIYGYFAAGWNEDDAKLTLARVLLGDDAARVIGTNSWLLMWPEAPSSSDNQLPEGNSEIDLTIGDIAVRAGTTAGVTFHPSGGPSWVCMVEAKWLSDISYQTTHDPHRNQLVRVIENAVMFGDGGTPPSYPDRVHVTLLTPACFRDTPSRLYWYKYRDYGEQRKILADLAMRSADPNDRDPNLLPPHLVTRLGALRLHWATFEELLHEMPPSDYKVALTNFIRMAAGGLLKA